MLGKVFNLYIISCWLVYCNCFHLPFRLSFLLNKFTSSSRRFDKIQKILVQYDPKSFTGFAFSVIIHFHLHVFISLPTLDFIVNFFSLFTLVITFPFLAVVLFTWLTFVYSSWIVRHLACLLLYFVYSSSYLSLSLLFKLLECPFLFRLVGLNDHLSCLFNPPSLSSSSYSSYSVSSWRTSSGFRVALIVSACQPGEFVEIWEEIIKNEVSLGGEGAPQLKSPCLVYELCSKVLVVIFTFLTFRPKISPNLRMLPGHSFNVCH